MTPRRKVKYSRRKPRATRQSVVWRWVGLAGVILLAVAILLWKNAASSGKDANSALEAQLDAALQTGQPTFVFLHSLDCVPCKEMMSIVDQIFPEFKAAVALIDVDVYDERNASLLRRERLQAIPTLVFYNRKGERQTFVGVMPVDQFRATLQSLATGD